MSAQCRPHEYGLLGTGWLWREEHLILPPQLQARRAKVPVMPGERRVIGYFGRLADRAALALFSASVGVVFAPLLACPGGHCGPSCPGE